MPYHHEYHLAAAVDKETEASVIYPVISAVNGNRNIQMCQFLIGICALVVAGIVIIALCIHPPSLLYQVEDEQSNSSAKSALLLESFSVSLVNNESVISDDRAESIRKELLKVVSPKNVYEQWYVHSLSLEQLESILQLRTEFKDHLENELTKDQLEHYKDAQRATYISTWLRASDWVVEDAKDRIFEHLDWRAEYDIDSVLEGNFSYFETELPIYAEGVDKIGGPVFCLSIEEWDLRKVTVGGHRREFVRYVARMFEKNLRIGAVDQDNGRNISQAMLILNINKYSLTKHGCFQCISLLAHLFGMDDQYPGWLHHIILINTSELADVVVDLVVPYLTGENRAAVEVYGFNKEEWQKKILSLVDADQLRPEFGGTKVDAHES